MINIPSISLPNLATAQLRVYQNAVDSLSSYSSRVEQARITFKLYNVKANASFRIVRETLSKMCSGETRCMYCEDAPADEIEHIKPKKLYPEQTFDWNNYLYACGICNNGKRDAFYVHNQAGQLICVTRKRNAPVVPPTLGKSAFIDPRTEDPLSLLQMDLSGTGEITPVLGLKELPLERAKVSIELLKLNRSYLVNGRKNALTFCTTALEKYVAEKRLGKSAHELDHLVSAIARMTHRTVWHEMKRQHSRLPKLNELFKAAPEALGW